MLIFYESINSHPHKIVTNQYYGNRSKILCCWNFIILCVPVPDIYSIQKTFSTIYYKRVRSDFAFYSDYSLL